VLNSSVVYMCTYGFLNYDLIIQTVQYTCWGDTDKQSTA